MASMGVLQGENHCWLKTTQSLISHLENILWTNETKAELFGRFQSRYMSCKTKTAFHKENMVVQCWLIDGTINSALYLKIPSDHQFMFLQQDNGPKHTSKSSDCFKKVFWSGLVKVRT